MDTTTKLTGALPVLIIIAALFTTMASWVLLRRYKKATVKGMSKIAGYGTVDSTKKNALKGPAELRFRTLTDTAGREKSVSPNFKSLKSTLRTSRMIYLLSGLTYALFMTTAYIITSEGGFVIRRFLWLMTCFAWPTVISILLTKAKKRGIVQNPLSIYAILLVLVMVVTLIRNENLDFFQLVFFWLWVNGPSSLLLLLFLQKKIRAVGPIVLAFMVVALAGAFLGLEVLGTSDLVLEKIATIGAQIGIGAVFTLLVVLALGFTVFGFIGWFVLKLLGLWYNKKHFSDRMLTLYALFLFFGIVQSIALAFEGLFWFYTGPLAFLAYITVSKMGFKKLIKKNASNERSPKLLYLRVFALGRRSEQFFDQFTRWWGNIGGISLISGPDLATSAVEPHEFLDFMGGRLSRQFVKDKKDLDGRLELVDYKPDPDGRYRINDFFCRADNWKHTMQKLSRQSDVVLMDLRSFSSANMGCVFELEQLLDLVSLSEIMFLVDKTTDHAFLKETLNELWKSIDIESPNAVNNNPTVLLFQLQKSEFMPTILIEQLLEKAVL